MSEQRAKSTNPGGAAVMALAGTAGFDLSDTILRELGAEAYCRVARAFCEDFRAQLAELEVAGGAPTRERSLRFAHQLKGAAANVGAVELHALAVETWAGLEGGAASDLSPLLSCCRSVVEALDRVVP